MFSVTERDISIEPIDAEWQAYASQRLDRLTKPQGSLGRLELIAQQLAGILQTLTPRLEQKAIITMAADHGVVAEGVSAYPQAVTAQMIKNFLRGGAAINVLARHVGACVIVVDMGAAVELPPHPALIVRKIGLGTANMATGPAMTRAQACDAIQAGMEIVEDVIQRGAQLIGTGDMGIGNTTAASAVTAAMTGAAVETVTGYGTGIDTATHRRKMAVIQRTLALNQPDLADPLDVLAKVGGFELGGLIGVMLGAAQARRPVVVDGMISGAAALVATALVPTLKDYLFASHRSQEPGHQVALQHLGLSPLLDLQLRLGEGTGAVLAMPLIEAAAKILCEMATFDEAGVAKRSS